MQKNPYILTTIKSPMIRQSDGKVVSLTDHTTIEFEIIHELPTKPDYKVDSLYIKTKINELVSTVPNNPHFIQYILSSVRVPMICHDNNKIISLTDYTMIEVEMIHGIPNKPDYKVDSAYIQKKIHELLEEPIMEDPIMEDPIMEDPIMEDPIVEDPEIAYNEHVKKMDEASANKLRSLGEKFLLNNKHKKSSKKQLNQRSPSPEFSMKK